MRTRGAMAGGVIEAVMRRLLRESSARGALWMTPTGERVPVRSPDTHDTVAARLMGMDYDPDDWEHPMTPSDLYIDRGGVKVRSYDTPDLVSIALKRMDPAASRLAAAALLGQPPRRRLLVTTPEGGEDTTVGDFLREGAERFLREATKKKAPRADNDKSEIDVPPEDANATGHYGKYVFAPHRKKSRVPPEPNTPEEQAVFDDLYDHVAHNDPMGPDAARALKRDLATGAYSNILHEPRSNNIYRGIRLTRGALATLLGTRDFGQSGSADVSRFVDRGRASTSWTTSKAVAWDFAASGEVPYAVVLHARRTDNPHAFLEGPGGFYGVDALSYFDTEDETIGLGKIRIHRVSWRLNRDAP